MIHDASAKLHVNLSTDDALLEVRSNYEAGAGGDAVPGAKVTVEHRAFVEMGDEGQITIDLSAIMETVFQNPVLLRLLAEAFGDDIEIEYFEGGMDGDGLGLDDAILPVDFDDEDLLEAEGDEPGFDDIELDDI